MEGHSRYGVLKFIALAQGLRARIELYKYESTLCGVSPVQLYNSSHSTSHNNFSLSTHTPCSPKPSSLLLLSSPSWLPPPLNVVVAVGTATLVPSSAATLLRTRTTCLPRPSRASASSVSLLATSVPLLVLTATLSLVLVLEELDALLPPFAVRTTVSVVLWLWAASRSTLAFKSTLPCRWTLPKATFAELVLCMACLVVAVLS
jgi:hypothetical protein